MVQTAIVHKASPGFWINRILTPYMNEAGHLLAAGVAIEEIDQLMGHFRFPLGPIPLLAGVGMEVREKVAGVAPPAFGARFPPGASFAGLGELGGPGREAGERRR